MKPFVSPYPIQTCKTRLVNLQSNGFLGFIRVKVKLILTSDGNCHYVLWKTMRGNFGQENTLAEVAGDLTVHGIESTAVNGISRMGRFYRILFFIYGLVLAFSFISYLTTQKFQYLFPMGFVGGLIGMMWLFTFYWRNQLEGMIERALLA